VRIGWALPARKILLRKQVLADLLLQIAHISTNHLRVCILKNRYQYQTRRSSKLHRARKVQARTLILIGVLILSLISVIAQITPTAPAEFDLVISSGRILDGTGNPWFEADVGISNGKIVEIGKIDPARGQQRIDAKGLIVAPGFIDVHTHLEGAIEIVPDAENLVMMGVTTVVTGNCGSSALNLAEWFETVSKNGTGVNIASLVGHNTVRRAAMGGDFNRPPSPEEMGRMRELIEQAMKDGAVGFSSGLEYLPGAYANQYELTELAKVSGRFGGLYATHMRDEGEFVEKSVNESIAIGEKANCPVEISHFKISSKKRWGAAGAIIKLVEAARSRGVQVTVDQYVYPASSTDISILFYPWLFEGGGSRVEERLKDPTTRDEVRKDVVNKARAQGFTDLSFAYIASYDPEPTYNGKNIAEITRLVKNKTDIDSQAEMAIELLQAGGARLVLRKMSEADVETILKQTFTMIASDAGVMGQGGTSVPHPRNFGNNARTLGFYVRDRKVLTLPEAIRRMTSLPAQTFKMWDRGLVRPGMAADLVLFDEKRVSDLATFEQPKRHPMGIDYVIVNGKVAVRMSMSTQPRAGQILRWKALK
jgi:N-acyl-D-amino-acid deacylase